jgi:hypothetical protein
MEKHWWHEATPEERAAFLDQEPFDFTHTQNRNHSRMPAHTSSPAAIADFIAATHWIARYWARWGLKAEEAPFYLGVDVYRLPPGRMTAPRVYIIDIDARFIFGAAQRNRPKVELGPVWTDLRNLARRYDELGNAIDSLDTPHEPTHAAFGLLFAEKTHVVTEAIRLSVSEVVAFMQAHGGLNQSPQDNLITLRTRQAKQAVALDADPAARDALRVELEERRRETARRVRPG